MPLLHGKKTLQVESGPSQRSFTKDSPMLKSHQNCNRQSTTLRRTCKGSRTTRVAAIVQKSLCGI